MDWQPIETAPKNGTRVLGVSPLEWRDEAVSVTFFASSKKWVHEAVVTGNGYGSYEHGYWDPTHWMPLPVPPKHD